MQRLPGICFSIYLKKLPYYVSWTLPVCRGHLSSWDKPLYWTPPFLVFCLSTLFCWHLAGGFWSPIKRKTNGTTAYQPPRHGVRRKFVRYRGWRTHGQGRKFSCNIPTSNRFNWRCGNQQDVMWRSSRRHNVKIVAGGRDRRGLISCCFLSPCPSWWRSGNTGTSRVVSLSDYPPVCGHIMQVHIAMLPCGRAPGEPHRHLLRRQTARI